MAPRGSTARRCAAISPTCRPAATPSARSPGKRLGAAPLLRVARAHGPPSRSTPRPVSPRRRATARLPRVLARRRAARCSSTTRLHVIDADDDAIRLRDDAVLELLYGSGLRVAELCGLSPADLDLRRARSPVWGKGIKQRSVPLSAPAVEAVSALARATGRPQLVTDDSPADAVFLNRRGGGSRPATCAGSSTAGPPRRPTPTPCATPSPRTCSTVVPTCVRCRSCSGHADLATTQHYTHVSQGAAPPSRATHPRA